MILRSVRRKGSSSHLGEDIGIVGVLLGTVCSNSVHSLGDKGTTVAGGGFEVAVCSIAWASAWRRSETAIEPRKHPCFMRVENAAAPMICTSGGSGRASRSGLGVESSVSSSETMKGSSSIGSLESMVRVGYHVVVSMSWFLTRG